MSTILDDEGLIGREMFAIDGVKLPSNASKHRSGTRKEFLAKAQKLERVAAQMLQRHRDNDRQTSEPSESVRITARIERMTREARKIRDWLAEHPEDRTGPGGGLRKSNMTDNESAKLATDKGVIQATASRRRGGRPAPGHRRGASARRVPSRNCCCRCSMPAPEQRTPDTLITADRRYHSEANLRAGRGRSRR